MSLFKFNFSGDDAMTELEGDSKEEIKWLESEEVVPKYCLNTFDNMVTRANMFTYKEIEIGHVLSRDAIMCMKESDLSNFAELAEKEHSDLVTGNYEGGLKIWECTKDLLEYLSDNEDEISFKYAKVLDLGCGSGLLGIYAFVSGASITFQDYNKEVLEYVTIPNVLLNIEEEDRETEIAQCKFYSGDWASFNKILPDDQTYDLILTSETIYNTDNYEKLIGLFSKRLKPQGQVYVAAKTYYFGVGGGTRQFESYLDNNNSFTRQVCWKSESGIQREILKITKKS